MKALAIQPGSPQCFTLSVWQWGALYLVEKWGEVSWGFLRSQRAPPLARVSAFLNAIDYVMQAKAKSAALIINPAPDSLLNNKPPPLQTAPTLLLLSCFFPYLAFIEVTRARAKWGLSDGGFFSRRGEELTIPRLEPLKYTILGGIQTGTNTFCRRETGWFRLSVWWLWHVPSWSCQLLLSPMSHP